MNLDPGTYTLAYVLSRCKSLTSLYIIDSDPTHLTYDIADALDYADAPLTLLALDLRLPDMSMDAWSVWDDRAVSLLSRVDGRGGYGGKMLLRAVGDDEAGGQQ